MGNEKKGLTKLADLGAALRAKAEEAPLPRVLRVFLKEVRHPKTGEREWRGFYDHHLMRLHVVCAVPWQVEMPDSGQEWLVTLVRRAGNVLVCRPQKSALEDLFLSASSQDSVEVKTLLANFLRRGNRIRITSPNSPFSAIGRVNDSAIKEVPHGFNADLSMSVDEGWGKGGPKEISVFGLRLMSNSQDLHGFTIYLRQYVEVVLAMEADQDHCCPNWPW